MCTDDAHLRVIGYQLQHSFILVYLQSVQYRYWLVSVSGSYMYLYQVGSYRIGSSRGETGICIHAACMMQLMQIAFH